MSTFEQSLNPQTNKLRQLALKKQKKQQLRAQSKVAMTLGNAAADDKDDDKGDVDMKCSVWWIQAITAVDAGT